MVKVIYQTVSIRGQKSGKCLCGKRLVRQKTFEQTINPFNKNAAGKVKSHAEIMTELQQWRSRWMGEPVRHDFPQYWRLPDDQRKEYETTGRTVAEMSCGVTAEMRKHEVYHQ